ncbi:aminopeptidase [Thalassotalea profundi]|uniref:Aminopeptidase n=1 Tax=Thalassotalea profundi TaxID=2036687 RepID=A0ABQ3IFD5_9GAMM|nr:aminopeptidase [Thalassotalea profundi]
MILMCFFIASCTYKKSLQSTPFIIETIDTQYLLTDFKVLSSDKFQGRKSGTLGSQLAQQYLIEQLQQHQILPFRAHYQHQFSIPKESITGTNIVAIKKGYEDTGKIIVVSAHYDHLGKSGHSIFNGADDNASGTAAVLTIAKHIVKNPLKHDVVFLFSDAEELNLLGTKAFLNDIGLLKERIIININLDMLAGSTSERQLFFIHRNLDKLLNPINNDGLTLLQRSLQPRVVSNFRRGKGSHINNRVKWSKASDHAAFNEYAIPYIYFGVGTHKNYHTVDDDFENANVTLFVKNVQNIYKQLVYIDRFSYK